jgi:hypothetical protein
MSTFLEELEVLQKEFDYLFSIYKFKIIYKKEYRADHYSLGLESPNCDYRIKFERELAPRWGMFVGETSSQFFEDLNKWHPIEKVIAKLNLKLDYSKLSGAPYYTQVKGSLEVLGSTLRPIFNKVKADLISKST